MRSGGLLVGLSDEPSAGAADGEEGVVVAPEPFDAEPRLYPAPELSYLNLKSLLRGRTKSGLVSRLSRGFKIVLCVVSSSESSSESIALLVLMWCLSLWAMT